MEIHPSQCKQDDNLQHILKCMFVLTVSTAEPKNIKEAMAVHTWIEAMQEELYQFDRLNVWELVDKPFGKTLSDMHMKRVLILKNLLHQSLAWKLLGSSFPMLHTNPFQSTRWTLKQLFLMVH
ncbi:hypothetical protein Tco_1424475 [Tanacetum coccineum]